MTSKPLFVYLQRPDNGEWVTVGRYLRDAEGKLGKFQYAPSYLQAGLYWSIDPVNLPLIPGSEFMAHRYGGLHDILRDGCPDAWGKLLLQREYGLSTDTADVRYLELANNADSWGALAVGPGKKPSISKLASPRIAKLETLTKELLAIVERRPPVDASLRKRLIASPSLGGARPKATVRDGVEFWLVKPQLPTDTTDIPRLEHFTQQWGSASGLNFSPTVFHSISPTLSVVRSLRFDRKDDRRIMAISGASLLGAEYPGGGADASRWSYPRLSEELKRIGAPKEDCIELFRRMVFNAVIGNDDDHPRNHAVIFNYQENRWRLAPAFDVVPHPDETPTHLTLQLSLNRRDISKEAILADAVRFGFYDQHAAATHLTALLDRFYKNFEMVEHILNPSSELHKMMSQRLKENLQRLS
jgi:serine/threonine-protein kinase HipA